MNYVFVTKIGRETSMFERSCRDDLSARNIAKSNPSVFRVETEDFRIVYRKPLTDSELGQIMMKRKR